MIEGRKNILSFGINVHDIESKPFSKSVRTERPGMFFNSVKDNKSPIDLLFYQINRPFINSECIIDIQSKTFFLF